MKHLLERSRHALDLKWFRRMDRMKTLDFGDINDLMHPKDPQYVLRMPIITPRSNGLQLPIELYWLKGFIHRVSAIQRHTVGISHPYCYVTVRYGPVTSETDDQWHVDGYTARISHLPEQNYIRCNRLATECFDQTVKFPKDFDPLIHNMSTYFEKVFNGRIQKLNAGSIYLIDPYVIHRRPRITDGQFRSFIRISFVPTEIIDDNFTPNPLIPIEEYGRDAVKDFRDKLISYHNTKVKFV